MDKTNTLEHPKVEPKVTTTETVVVGGPTFEKGKSYKGVAITVKVFIYIFLSIFAVIMVVPFIFMISMGLRDPQVYINETNGDTVRFITTNLTNINFKIILGGSLSGNDMSSLPESLAKIITDAKELGRGINFVPYFINTFVVAVVSTVFTVITTVLTAFAFARLNFKGKNALFTVLLGTMMIPGEMMLITNIATVQSMNMHNTFSALIFVHGISVFYIFQLRQSFQQIPNELFLAAKVDGYGEFRYLAKVMIPIAMPTIVTIIILNFMGSWNALMWPNAIARGNNRFFYEWFEIEHPMKLVSNGLMEFFSGTYSNFDTVKLAGSMVISAPLLLIFIFFRKYIMRGVSRSGIKG